MSTFTPLVTLRFLRRRKGFTALSVAGLAVGLAAVMLISLYVRDERAFDRFHENGDRTYRLVTEETSSLVGWPFGRLIEDEVPGVEAVTYLRTWPVPAFRHDGETRTETIVYADDRFLDVFSFPVLVGDAATALDAPFSVVLSDAFAARLFGGTEAVGQTLTFADTLQATVTGVVEVPRQSHLQFDALLSFASLRTVLGPEFYDAQFAEGWGNWNVANYALLAPGTDPEAVAAQVRGLPMERAGDLFAQWGATPTLGLEPLADVYLRTDLGNSLGPVGSQSAVNVLVAIGVFLLLLAMANFVNLATARSVERAREVGVRKVVGAGRASLVRQYLAESVVVALVAGVFALALAALARPWFNELTARDYSAGLLLSPSMLLVLVGVTVGAGVLAGVYPAIVMSGFSPGVALRGRFARSARGVRLRQGLVVFQFAVTCVLVTGTLVVVGQIRHMQSQSLGFDQEQVLMIDARGVEAAPVVAQAEAFKQALATSPAVTDVTSAWGLPGQGGWPGQPSFPEGAPDGEGVALEYVHVDPNYLPTLGLELVAGRDFDAARVGDVETAVIINEEAARIAGWSPEAAVGKAFPSPGSGKPEARVVGVVRDFHQHGLQEPIGPVMFGLGGPSSRVFAVRTQRPEAAIAHARRTWAQFGPEGAFTYQFLDDVFEQQYQTEVRTAKVFTTFSGLAILVALLGLMGMAAYAATQRTKEVGVRKVLGASVAQLVGLLSRDFLVLVGIGFAIATPLAVVAAGRWLESFAYRVPLGVEVFALAGLVLLGAALPVVGYHAVRAATSDPVRALRSE